MVVVAQLVRVSVCGTEGRGFESRLPPRKQKLLFLEKLFLYTVFKVKRDEKFILSGVEWSPVFHPKAKSFSL